jgi:hypothetical protein
MTCGIEEIIPPILTVTDQVTGKPICDAVAAKDPGSGELSPCISGEQGCTGKCQYTVLGDGSGSGPTFSIEVTAPGYQAATVSGLMTNSCGCTSDCPSPQEALVALTPLPPLEDGGTDDGGH